MKRNNNWESNLFWLIVAIVVGAYVFVFGFLKKMNEWYYVIRLGKNKYNSLPVGDMGWPFIGNMFSFFKAFTSPDPDSFINNMIHRFGRTGIYKTNLFWDPSIIVCNPEMCRKVLEDDERFSFSYPSPVMKLIGKKSLHGVSMAEHKHLRKLISASFNGHESLSRYIGYIEDIVISSLEDWVNKKSPIQFLIEWKKINANVITKVFMGSDYSISETTAKYLSVLYHAFSVPLAINLPGFSFHTGKKARNIMEKIAQTQMDEIRAKKTDEVNTKKATIHQLLEAKDKDGEKLEDQHIINLLLSFLIAGDTATLAAMWLAIYLHRHPEMLQRAKEEQEEIIKRRPSSQNGLTLKEIRQMEFLSKAIDETLRLSYIGFTKFRKAEVDVEINGYLIPKGWKVLVWSRAVHIDSEIYSNPKEFLPSRWDSYNQKAGSFTAFGAGSRICPGADLAKLELSIFFHYFLLNYRFELMDSRSPIKYLTYPRPMDNCLMKITKLP